MSNAAPGLQKRFRNRILFYLFLFGLPPMLIGGIFSYRGSIGLVRGFLETETQYKASEVSGKLRVASNLDRFFVGYVAHELATHPPKGWDRVLESIAKVQPELYSIHVFGSDGFTVLRSDGKPHINVTGRQYVTEALAGNNEQAQQIVLGRTYGQAALCTGHHIQNTTRAVAICRFVGRLLDEVQHAQIGRAGYIFMIDNEKKVLAHPSLPFLSDQLNPAEKTAVAGVATKPSGSRIDFEIDGTKYSAHAHNFNGWTVVALYSADELSAVLTHLFLVPVGVGILCLFVVMALTFVAVDRSTRPLANLTRATRGFGPDNLNVRVPVIGSDEMGILAEAFNDMATRLNAAISRLRAKENDLENQILLQSQKLAYATKMTSLGEMAGGIAHEVNNPLAIISMHAQRLREKIADGQTLDPKELSETLQKIENTCVRINHIIRGLRLFSRDGRQDPFVLENLSSIVSDAVGMCGETLKNSGITLDVDCPEDIELECQPVQLGQVLLNLLTNARDALRDGRTKHPKISVRAREFADFVELRVQDNGPGIPDHLREKIMQPFYTTKAQGKGMGLGLSISLGIIQQHHGELGLEGRVEGTVFVLKIPRHQKKIS